MLLLLLTPALPGVAAPAGEWPCYGADANRSHAVTSEISPPLGLAWTYRPAQPPQPAWPEPGKELHRIDFDYCFQPVSDGRLVFFGSSADDCVRALDLKTGEMRWRFPTGGPVRFAPVLHEGRCYVASDDGVLYCLDAQSGRSLPAGR